MSERVRTILAECGERRESAHAAGPDDVVPQELIAAALAFEERYGGLAYRPEPAGNRMEYGFEGEVSFWWTSEYGWTMPAAALDGSWTWDVDLLLDGRTSMTPGNWAPRLIDRSLDQRLEKHALLAQVRLWPHFSTTFTTEPHVLPVVTVPDVPAVPEASGPADLWWFDGDRAAHLTLRGWPEGSDQWVLRRFARASSQLSDAEGEPDEWCSICSRPLQPGLSQYTPEGGPGHCRPLAGPR